jgi:hypothetical protein
MAISDFPLWRVAVENIVGRVDDLYVRFDGVQGDPEILRALPGVAGERLRHVDVVREPWHPPQWRQDCLMLLDNADHKPDVVLCPDQDEVFGEGLESDLKRLMESDRDALMFGYDPLVTVDGREVNAGRPYPPEPHMKAFKWRAGLSYYPWHRSAIVAQYVNPLRHMQARSKIKHYCCYTPGLEALKTWRSDIPGQRAHKAVTLLGFGPSAHKDGNAIAGEVWSLNNCYEVFGKDTMMRCTRIFDMHKFGPREGGAWDDARRFLELDGLLDRNDLRMKDGKRHIEHLDALGRLGHRIVMQCEHPDVFNSERYPLARIENEVGVQLWSGTGAYMVAQAVSEGFTEIRVYGFDQGDPEHVSQREGMTGLLMFALGRGTTLSGSLAFAERHRRRYGYDWGPEMDMKCLEENCAALPVVLLPKAKTRKAQGAMYGYGGL